jgi:hypothetical protein
MFGSHMLGAMERRQGGRRFDNRRDERCDRRDQDITPRRSHLKSERRIYQGERRAAEPTDHLDAMARGIQRAVLEIFDQAEQEFLKDIARNVLADGMSDMPRPDRRRGCTC